MRLSTEFFLKIIRVVRQFTVAWVSVLISMLLTLCVAADYVAAGGEDYDLFTDNCIHAANRMMELN